MKSRKIFIFALLIFLFFNMVFVYSQTAPTFQGQNQQTFGGGGSFLTSNPQVSTPGFSVSPLSPDGNFFGITPRESFELCQQRQDFIVKISPGGCTPNVVRSDLLAEQDVPVFCKLQAIQINPLIETSSIKNIFLTPTGTHPQGVRGVSYYKPRIALNTQKNSQGFGTIDNIGYAVIILQGNPNERNLPDSINGTLNARIDYDAFNSFGFGINSEKMRILSDEEWRENYIKYGFFDGKGYLRLEEVDINKARISIYADVDRKIDSFIIEKGKTSSERYLPGFFCNAAYTITYIDSSKPETSAKIMFDYDSYNVYSGEKFADDLCSVGRIISDGFGGGSVDIFCRGGKKQTLNLKNMPIKLTIDDIEREYNVGDFLYQSGEKKVYLGGIGKYVKGEKLGKSFVVLVDNTNNMRTIRDHIEKISNNNPLPNGEIKIIDFDEEKNHLSKNVKFFGLSKIEDISTGNSDFENYFKASIDGYKDIEETYNGKEEYKNLIDNSGKSIGEIALKNAISLSKYTSKEKTYFELVKKFRENYGSLDGESSIFTNLNTKEANYVFELDGTIHRISLVSIEEPEFKRNGVKILVDGEVSLYNKDGEYIIPPHEGKSDIQLKNFDENGIEVVGNCVSSEGKLRQEEKIALGQKKSVCSKSIEVREINIDRVANIRLNPINRRVGGVVNFSYFIGIEKRAIELSPDKAIDRIKKLNETIEKLENINKGLGKAVEGMKAACFATSAALQVKNLFGSLRGKAIARSIVMQEKWNAICNNYDPSKYNSIDHCYSANNDAIENDVNALHSVIKKQNDDIRVSDSEFKSESKGIFARKSIDYEKAFNKYKDSVIKKYGDNEISYNGNNIKVSDALNGVDDYETLKKIDLNLRIRDSIKDEKLLEVSNKELFDSLNQAKMISLEREAVKNTEGEASNLGIVGVIGVSLQRDEIVDGRCYFGSLVNEGNKFSLDKGTPIQKIIFEGTQYYVALDNVDGNGINGNLFGIKKDSENSNGGLIYYVNGTKVTDNTLINKIIDEFGVFKECNSETYNNAYTTKPLVRYYEREPFKGMPAIVPFDVNRGWYAATKQTLPAFGNVGAFQESGRVSSFWLCNVGENGREEFNSGLGDDICQQINTFTGQTRDRFPGLSDEESMRLIDRAIRALESAASQYKVGVKEISIENKRIGVGNPAANIPELQCQNFMSPNDCKLMFNVCDPVICPSSRCNLGGKFYVDDVVQTGIIGSAVMCLPNVREGIVIPVCLTGIHSGIDNFLSILKAYKACLEENIETGRYVGICDEITAIYQCEFFWNQVSPAMNVLLPKLLESITGQTARGGGEYLNVQVAWSNMQNSINFFKQSYGLNAFKAYNLRSTQEVGTQMCKGFISTKYPNKFKTFIKPDSPPQYSASFFETPMSSAAVPPISSYKVFYHIFAGNDIGTHYNIYLRNPEGSSFYTSSGNVIVATGFVPRGGFVDESRDFTAPSGFRELCIRVNFQEKCGFKQVSTSFAFNYIRDKYVETQLKNTDIKTERECIAGTSVISGGNALGLVNPNLQAGVKETLSPKIYERGIIRICSTDNPGFGSDENRFVKVGICGDNKIGCWLDRYSIDRAITPGHNVTIEEINELVEKKFSDEGSGFTLVDDSEIERIKTEIGNIHNNEWDNLNEKKTDAKIIIAKIESLLNKNLLDSQKAKILFYRAHLNEVMAKGTWNLLKINEQNNNGGNNDNSAPVQNGNQPTPSQNNGPMQYEVEVPNNPNYNINLLKGSLNSQKIYLRCIDFVNDIFKYSSESSTNGSDIDPLLVLAVMIKESSCNHNANSEHTYNIKFDEGASYGLMQISGRSWCGKFGLPSNASTCKSILLNNQSKNIEVGVRILVQNYEMGINKYYNGREYSCNEFNSESQNESEISHIYTGWAYALRAYNGWGCAGKNNNGKEIFADQDYVVKVNEIYKNLKQNLNNHNNLAIA
ncbi:MAG: transglycosylase SLT domain-containing protein [Candidatus Pacearchaeota archaeon]